MVCACIAKRSLNTLRNVLKVISCICNLQYSLSIPGYKTLPSTPFIRPAFVRRERKKKILVLRSQWHHCVPIRTAGKYVLRSLLSAAVLIQRLIFVLFSCQPHLKNHYFVLEPACYGRPAHQLYSTKANKTECCIASYCRLNRTTE